MSGPKSGSDKDERGGSAGWPMAIDPNAESASPDLPAFLAPPPGSPAYHGFPILDGVQVDGWRLGLITDSIDTDDTAGDAFVIAPDGRRAGLVWRIEQPSWFVELIGPEPGRFGVFEVAARSGPTSINATERFLREILPPIVDAWNRSSARPAATRPGDIPGH
jgi:hypothetical protein